MNYSHRIWIYGPVAVLLLIVAGYCAFWYFATAKVSDWLDAHNGREVMPGVVFAFAEKDVGGFPFRADVVLGGVTFSRMTPEGETALRAEKLALHALPYDFGHYIFETSGLLSIARPPEGAGLPTRVLYVTPQVAHASALLDGDRLTRVDVDLVNIATQDATLGAPPGRTSRVGRMQLHFRADPDRTIDMAFRIDNAQIGPGYQPPLGPDLSLFLVTGKLTEAPAFEGLRHGRAGFLAALETWRKANGIVSVDNFQFNWGGVAASAKGSMRFDERHRPHGKITAQVAGYDKLIAAAQMMGHINQTESTIANAALAAMAQLAGDAQGRLPVTFTFRDGKFKVGPITADTLEPVY